MKTLGIKLEDIVIRPITNEDDFEKASELIDKLIDADQLENPDERQSALELLDAITTLAVAYEKKHYPIPVPDPIEAIKQRMEMLNFSQKDVAELFGGTNRVSEVLNLKRPLTLKMAQNLHHGLGIPAEVFFASK